MEVTKNLYLVFFDILNSHGYQTTVQMGIWKTTYIFDKNIDYNYLLFFTINLNQCHFIVCFFHIQKGNKIYFKEQPCDLLHW